MKVLLFARFREIMGQDSLEMALPPPTTISELRRRLMDEHPRLAGLLMKSRFAVNDEFADDDTVLSENAEIALLPPVSGG